MDFIIKIVREKTMKLHYKLNKKQWNKFLKVLAKPLKNEKLKKLMETKAPWEKEGE